MLANLILTSSTPTSVAGAMTGVDLSSMLSEILQLLPVILPTLVGFMAVRKGISFLLGSLRRA